MDIEWYYWVIILLSMLLLASWIPSRPSLHDMERFFVYPKKDNRDSDTKVENFGFEDDQSADINLVVSGLNDCNAVIGSGDGVRDMFDFSNRFISAQIEASNNIPMIHLSKYQTQCR